MFKITCATLAIVSVLAFSSCGNTSGDGSSTSGTNSSKTKKATDGMKTYKDDLLSFQYPDEWDLNTVPLQNSTLKGSTSYRLKTKGADHEFFWFSMDEAPSYNLFRENLDAFIELNNEEGHEVLRKADIVTKSGVKGYYFEMKKDNEYFAFVSLPADATSASYNLNGSFPMSPADYEQCVKNGELLAVFESLDIKIK